MSARQETFEEAVLRARNYEVALSEWLQSKYGYHVLPTYDYSGLGDSKAPKLYCGESGLVIPDLLACKAGKTTWMECKWKTRADLHRKTGHYVTGINQRHYNHYCEVERISGAPVHIAFLHVTEGEVRIEKLSVLHETIHHTYGGEGMGRNGMVFWRYDTLPLYAKLSDLITKPP